MKVWLRVGAGALLWLSLHRADDERFVEGGDSGIKLSVLTLGG